MSDNDHPLERAVELFVYAPIGLAMFAKDTVPTFLKMFVSRGQTEVESRRRTAGSQASQYKTVGQMAVRYGGPEIKRQAGAAAESVRRKAEVTLSNLAQSAAATGADTGGARPAPARPVPATAPAPPPAPSVAGNGGAPAPAPGPDELPIPGYDLLSATQVIERLDGLGRADLAVVREYELAHRARTTILGKIGQLTS